MSEQETTPVKKRRRLWWYAGGAVALLALAAGCVCLWLTTSWCEDWVRRSLIARMEEATGGRVEIGAFHWHPFDLEAEADNIVIHGKEQPSEAPYVRVARLSVKLSVLGVFSPRILLRSLDAQQPAVHLIVYPDGTTNQPTPHKTASKGKPALDTFFAMKAGLVSVEQGVIDYESRASNFDFEHRRLPFEMHARDVAVQLAYADKRGSTPEHYHAELGARDFSLVRGDASKPTAKPVEGYLQASVDLMRSAAVLRWLRITARSKGIADRTLEISGTLSDFSHPHWQARVKGDLDMRLIEPATGYPNTPEGIAHVDLEGEGRGAIFRGDGLVHADGAAYVGTGVAARGLTLDAHVHADPAQLRITPVTVKLRSGGTMSGEVLLEHWISATPASDVVEPAPPKPARRGLFRRKSAPAEQAAATPQQSTKPKSMNGRVDAKFQGVSLDAVMEMVTAPPFQHLGLNTLLNGPATATWTDGDVNTLAVSASLGLTPSGRTIAGETPASGVIDATYTQRDGAVNLRQLALNMPSSSIRASGHVGAYPLSSPSAITVDFESRNLGEFDTLLRDLGLSRNGQEGSAALPLVLNGEADFHGTWGGSLVDPHLAGELNASNIDLQLPDGEQMRKVHFDAIEAAGNYSESRIAVDHAHVRIGGATMEATGSLTAVSAVRPALAADERKAAPHRHTGKPEFDANSQLHAQLRASKLDMQTLLPLVGSTLPITGQLNAQLQADGPLNTLGGSGWVELNNAVVYGEPIARMRAQGSITGEVLHLNSITVNDDAGAVAATGSYDLQSKQFHIDAHTNAIDMARVEHLKQAGLNVTGNAAFTITGAGTVDDPRLQMQATLSKLTLGGEPVGRVDITAHTANRTAYYDITTALDSAALKAHGQTALSGDYETQAKLDFSQFNIGALLKMAHISGLTGESSLAGTVNVAGPLAHVEQLHGEAQLQQMAVTVSGVHLRSEGGLRASLQNGHVNLDPLHITGEETDLHVQGGFDIRGKRQLDMASSGTINLKLLETIDPDLTASGTTTFKIEAHGTLDNPGLRGRIDFQDASLALEDLPNSLSQLHGTLEFNQNRLEVRSLTATSGGGQLSVSGYLSYQHGIFANLNVTGKGIRIRYPQGVSSLADANLQLQGPQKNLLLSGNILITRFSVSPDLDFIALASQTAKVQPVAPPEAPSNHVRLDVHIVSSPQLNFQNAFAKLAGDVDLRLRGTLATPSLLGRISITEGNATIAGTRYELQRGDITFTNPVRIQPSIDLNATARVEDYDITLGLHGSPDKLAVSYRSDPPLPEADVVALLALGRTENQQRIYTQQQEQLASNPTTDSLLGGALNATVSSRVQKLFGAGSVKVDPSYLGALGNSTTRITVEEQLGRNLTLTYATNVNTTAQQLLQAEIAINRHVSLLILRDESGVFSMVVKATRRYR